MHNKNGQKRLTASDWFKGSLQVAEFVVLACGLAVAWVALADYRRANVEAVNSRIEELDRAAYLERLKNDKFSSLFASAEELSLQNSTIASCRKLLELSVEKKHRRSIKEWNNVGALYDIIWGLNDYDKPYKPDLRSASTHADLVFYTVNEAYSAYSAGLMDEATYKTWAAYITDTGHNPLMVLSIYMAHESGYIDISFASEVRSLMLGNDRTRTVIKAIYPEMEEAYWPDTVGASTIAGHKPLRPRHPETYVSHTWLPIKVMR